MSTNDPNAQMFSISHTRYCNCGRAIANEPGEGKLVLLTETAYDNLVKEAEEAPDCDNCEAKDMLRGSMKDHARTSAQLEELQKDCMFYASGFNEDVLIPPWCKLAHTITNCNGVQSAWCVELNDETNKRR